MIKIKDTSKTKINSLNKDNFYVVADFDKTITTKDSNTTFSLFAESGLYGDQYLEERSKNYNYFRPLELNPNITNEEKYNLMKKWQETGYQLMLENKVKESDIRKILENKDLLELRKGAITFIKLLNENNIPLIINSAGCGNFIIELLKINNCCSNNIHIHSNILEFKDDIIIDSITNIIHSMNKYDIVLSDNYLERIINKEYTIIIGDQLSDLNMANNLPTKEILAFGFLEENISENKELFYKEFDISLEDNEDFNQISKILKLRK